MADELRSIEPTTVKPKKQLTPSQKLRLRILGYWQEFYQDRYPDFEKFYAAFVGKLINKVETMILEERAKR